MAVLDLGAGHKFVPSYGGDGTLVGWLHHHAAPDGKPCASFCAIVTGYGPAPHQVVSWEPLTLAPSLKCRMCGCHGHVIDGEWRYVS